MKSFISLLMVMMIVVSLCVPAFAQEKQSVVTLDVSSLTVKCGNSACFSVNGGIISSGIKMYRGITGSTVSISVFPDPGYHIANIIFSGLDTEVKLNHNSIEMNGLYGDAFVEIVLSQLGSSALSQRDDQIIISKMISEGNQAFPENRVMEHDKRLSLDEGEEYLLYNENYEPVNYCLTEVFHSAEDLHQRDNEMDSDYEKRVQEYLENNPNIIFVENVDLGAEQRSILLSGVAADHFIESGADKICFTNEQTAVMLNLDDFRSEKIKEVYALFRVISNDADAQKMISDETNSRKASGMEMSTLRGKTDVTDLLADDDIEEKIKDYSSNTDFELLLEDIYKKAIFEIIISPIAPEEISGQFSKEETADIFAAIEKKTLCRAGCVVTYGDYSVDVTDYESQMQVMWRAEDAYYRIVSGSNTTETDPDYIKSSLEDQYTAFNVIATGNQRIVYVPVVFSEINCDVETNGDVHLYPRTTTFCSDSNETESWDIQKTVEMIEFRPIWIFINSELSESRINGLKEIQNG